MFWRKPIGRGVRAKCLVNPEGHIHAVRANLNPPDLPYLSYQWWPPVPVIYCFRMATQPITILPREFAAGDKAALDRLMPLVYSELRKLAAGHLRRENPGHTLQLGAPHSGVTYSPERQAPAVP
jgi:hypothetical protein